MFLLNKFFKAKYDVWMVLTILIFHFLLGFTSFIRESPTFDEPLHLTGGYSYWNFNDYRINPENGNFSQRWAAFPLMFDKNIKIADMGVFSADNHQFKTAFSFLYKSGNPFERMFKEARTMMLIMSVLLGLAVFFCSKRIFGRAGGCISLLLYAFSPPVLADARLVTSDLAVAFGFTISLWALWEFLNKVSIRNILFSTISVFILLTSKMSGVLIVPLFIIMFAVRLFFRRELPLVFFKFSHSISKSYVQFRVLALSSLAMALGVYVLLWAAYGFRFSMLSNEAQGRASIDKNWELVQKTNSGIISGLVAFARDTKILPEAYLFGFLHVCDRSETSVGFINGKYSERGFRYFFPYCALVKNPIPFLILSAGVFSLLLLKLLKRRRPLPDYFYNIIPFLLFIIVYASFAVSSKLNIGHRHILPLYPPIFIICGSAAFLFKTSCKKLKIFVVILIIWYIAENLNIWPHYIAYFNQIAGGPRQAYRHLVDSSLDWGQGLYGLKEWLSKNHLKPEANVYLSYFGVADIDSFKLGVKKLPCFLEQPQTEIFDYDFENGIFCISATMLQMQPPYPGLALWSEKHEAALKEISSEMKVLLKARENPEAFKRIINEKGAPYWAAQGRLYEILRFAKLCSILRNTGPDDNIGYSILIYRASSFRHLIKPGDFR